MTTIQDLLKRNLSWAQERVASDPEYFSRLRHLQTPRFLWIGCADSRVPANVITGLEPGEVFVHRNVANLVHPTDLNCLSVLQFAIEVLQVQDIIICGHYGCGGVQAAIDGKRHGLIDHWLEPIRDTARQHADLLKHSPDRNHYQDQLCELNVKSQVTCLSNTPIVQDAWKRGQSLHIHGWVYGLHDGIIRDLYVINPPSL